MVSEVRPTPTGFLFSRPQRLNIATKNRVSFCLQDAFSFPEEDFGMFVKRWNIAKFCRAGNRQQAFQGVVCEGMGRSESNSVPRPDRRNDIAYRQSAPAENSFFRHLVVSGMSHSSVHFVHRTRRAYCGRLTAKKPEPQAVSFRFASRSLFCVSRRDTQNKKATPCRLRGRLHCFMLRGQDLNLRPSGYEPDELPDCSTPHRLAKRNEFSF